MIWFALLLALCALVCLGLSAMVRGDTRGFFVFLALVSFTVGTVFGLIAPITTVDAGNVGIAKVFGKVQPYTLKSGIHYINPFASVTEMSVRTENYIMSSRNDEGNKTGDDAVIAISSNRLSMPMDVSIPYRLLEDNASWVYEHLGPNYVEKILRPAARAAVRRACAKYTDQECYATKRDELALDMKGLLEEEMTTLLNEYTDSPKEVISVSQVLIGTIGLPDVVRAAIEKKLAADQEQQEMDFRILREQKEATRKKEEANGIKQFQDIVSQGINENLLRWKAIDATLHLSESKNAKIIIIGSGKDGLPVILGNDGPIKE